jgi:hypothetical protein
VPKRTSAVPQLHFFGSLIRGCGLPHAHIFQLLTRSVKCRKLPVLGIRARATISSQIARPDLVQIRLDRKERIRRRIQRYVEEFATEDRSKVG